MARRKKSFSVRDVLYAADFLSVSFDRFSPQDLWRGMNEELEHGSIDPETNITNDDPILTAKIALAHLNKDPGFYRKHGR